MNLRGEEVKAYVPLPGQHMVINALAAACVGQILGMESKDILEGIASVKATGGRSNIMKLEDKTIIDDCYNANPVSMKAAIDLLQSANRRKVAVLGDMFELGEEEEALHYEVGTYTKGKVDFLICVGNLAKNIYEGAMAEKEEEMTILYLKEKEDIYSHLEQIIMPQDTILLKASHGMGFADIVSWFEKTYS